MEADSRKLNELFGYTDEKGVAHWYYGPPIKRKLGDFQPMFDAIAKQEKERGDKANELRSNDIDS